MHKIISTSSETIENDISEDRLLKNYDEFEDSAIEIAWSAGCPWTFASMSYNGHIVINFVPQEEKFKLLMQIRQDEMKFKEY